MKQLIKISQVKSNPNNPRLIKNDKFKKLVKSVQDFPEMLELRPIVVDENMIVLGGNMRLKACIEAGLKEVWIEIAEGLTEEQKKEFIVKDNVGFGDWEWDMLANEWDSVQLAEWGLDVWQNEDDIEDIEEVIDFNEDVNFIIKCENLKELEELKDKLKLTGTKTSYSKFKELLDL
jgi:ParB-like chromosome segregation protein Spo0J